MIVEIVTTDVSFSRDVKNITVNEQTRSIALHDEHGMVEVFNLDFIKRFKVPRQALIG